MNNTEKVVGHTERDLWERDRGKNLGLQVEHEFGKGHFCVQCLRRTWAAKGMIDEGDLYVTGFCMKEIHQEEIKVFSQSCDGGCLPKDLLDWSQIPSGTDSGMLVFVQRLKLWKNEVTWPRTAWSGPFTTTAIITSSHNCKEDQNFGTNQDSCSFGDGE